MATQSFWQVARRPKWIGALVLALIMAAVFAALGQWQLERSFRTIGHTSNEIVKVVPIDSLMTPGREFTEKADGRLVEFRATPNFAHTAVIANRIQNDASGYWLVTEYVLENGKSLIVAQAWFASQDKALEAQKSVKSQLTAQVIGDYSGWLLAPEAPEQADDAAQQIRKTLSPAELVNLWWPNQPREIYPGALAIKGNKLVGEQIEIGAQERMVELNFLNIFYAIEWVVFSGFAIFMWWRLVQDERLGLRDPQALSETGQKVN